MKGPLREVFEIAIEGDRTTHRVAYYASKDIDGPIVVLDVFTKRSMSGIATPKPLLDRIKSRLKRIKEIENE